MLRSLLAVLACSLTLGAMENTVLHVSGYGPLIRSYTLTSEGALALRSESPAGKNPSFIARHPDGTHLYAVSEVGEGKVITFALSADDGQVAPVNAVSSGGKGPCFCSVVPNGKWLLAANYGSGHVALIPILADGTLGNPSDVQQPGVNAHMAITGPDGRFVYVPCKGSDYIAQFRLDAKAGKLIPLKPATVATAKGAGPRHLAFAADGTRAYGINELDNTMTQYAVAEDGTLSVVASVPTLPEGFNGKNTTAHIALTHNDSLCFGSNRGHDSLVRTSIADDGTLTVVDHVGMDDGLKTPRHFAISPDGRFLVAAAQDGDVLLVYAIADDGALSLVSTTACDGKPCCVVFAP
jgi:6-phosphogluconolactonase